MVAKAETLKFDAEIGKVLNLVINSLYTNKDIFLRELLSNASDACDKLRYQLNQDEKLAENFKEHELKISIQIDEKQKQITISDSGIGMSRDELIKNLGTIAKSGTQAFINKLDEKEQKVSDLIGQFGVGFYSGFMVANKMTVISNKAGSKKTHIWSSKGSGEFAISEAEEQIQGTKIILDLKDDAKEFLDSFRIKNIVKTYSDHIAFPIELVAIEKDASTEVLNSSQALWSKPKAQVKKDEYLSFYKAIAHAADEPWLTLHNHVEGVITYTNLLFVPTKRPFDLFHPDRKCQVKLYAKKVFITEDTVEIVPSYLRFLRGVVDSQDISLNVSRETLQNNAVVEKIKSGLVKKILAELAKQFKKDREKYQEFWENFGSVLKEGLCEYSVDKEKILDICLFKTSKSNGKNISLAEYIAGMREDQKEIYYLIGGDLESLQDNPQLEAFKAKDIEVLLLTDGVDDFWLTTFPKFQEKEFKAVTRVTDELDNIAKDKKAEEKKEKEAEELKDLVAYFKEVLADRAEDVKISHKLTESPVCLAAAATGMDLRMERIMLEQGQLQQATKKILEINPTHSIIKNLDKKLKDNKDQVADFAKLLFDQACIVEGEAIKEPTQLAKRISALLAEQLS